MHNIKCKWCISWFTSRS